jgi:hypothetical protein
VYRIVRGLDWPLKELTVVTIETYAARRRVFGCGTI